MAKPKGAAVVNIDRCKGCGLCISACPVNVLLMAREVNGKGYHYAYMEHPGACTGCANCGIMCPDGAITVYRMKTEETVN